MKAHDDEDAVELVYLDTPVYSALRESGPEDLCKRNAVYRMVFLRRDGDLADTPFAVAAFADADSKEAIELIPWHRVAALTPMKEKRHWTQIR